MIDAGHGGEPGATAEAGMTEKEITLDVALRLRRLLKDAPFQVLLTRDTDRSLGLDQRVAFANENKADLFVSIHVNWMEPHTIRALETYYVGPTDDPAILQLAKRENKDSRYALSDYKKILEKIYVDARRDESRALAHTIQSQLFRTLRAENPELENRGVKTAPFAVLIGTQMPAILVEIACLSNEREAALLTKERLSGKYRGGSGERHSPLCERPQSRRHERQLIHGRNQRNTLRGNRPRHLAQLDFGFQRRTPHHR